MLLLCPEELVVEIMQLLTVKSQTNLMQCNKTLYRIGRDSKLWNKQEFPYRVHSLSGKRGLSRWLDNTDKGAVVTVPPARLCMSAAVFEGFMYVNGGHNTQENTQMFREVRSDFWRMSLVTRKWEEIVEPGFPTRTEHTAVVYGERLWLFAGFSGSGFLNDMVCYDLVHKQLVTVNPLTSPPNPRSAHGAVVHGRKMWVFGGWDGTHQNNELYTFDFETYAWECVETVGPKPPGRCSHCVAVAPDANSFFVFGGYGGENVKYLADLWQFSFDTMQWTCVGMLSPRSRMKMVEHDNKLYIYGGWNSKEHFGDMHEFDIRTRTWRQIDNGHAEGHGLLGQYGVVTFNKIMYVFGGYNGNTQSSTNEIQAYRMARPEFTEETMQCL
eukprot:TRINITY_DN3788_c0_g1_i1.p1 TRINITY_DN3788_c0_g1~~TRINITY_DN3788_c0_g1_i1.p1  ORF type:complete len:420 (-),score=133.43 TRINITY_DN3788_c0_g1_i1:1324-2472(-)